MLGLDQLVSPTTILTEKQILKFTSAGTISPSSSSSSSSTSSSSVSSTSTSSTSSTVPTPSPTGFTYLGCYEDAVGPNRILDQGPFTDNVQTIAKCLARCASGGYLYAGVEYGVECFCSTTLKSGAVKKPETDCSKPCAGKRLSAFSKYSTELIIHFNS